MKRAGAFGSILFCFLYLGFGQDLDSLNYFDQTNDYQRLREEVLKADQLDAQLAYYLARSFNQENVEAALKQTDSLLGLPVFVRKSSWKDRLLAQQLSLIRKQGSYNEAITQGGALIKSLEDPVSRFDVSHNVSISYRRINRYDSALRWGLPLVEEAATLGDTHRSHRAIQNMANLYSALKEYRKALLMEKSLIAIADEMQNADLQVLD